MRDSAASNSAISLNFTSNADNIFSKEHRQNDKEKIMSLHQSNCDNDLDNLSLLLNDLQRFSNS